MADSSFADFFYRNYPEQKLTDRLLNEMTMKIDSFKNKLQSPLNVELLDEVLKHGTLWKTWTCSEGIAYEVYSYQRQYEDSNTLYFIYNKQVIVTMIQLFVKDNVAHIDEVYGIGGRFKGSVARAYVEFLLPIYGAIVSDRIQTVEGFNIYRYLVANHEKLGISVSIWNIETDQMFVVNTSSELEQYFGEAPKFSLYRFMIQKNKK